MSIWDVIKELPGYAEKYQQLTKRFPQLRVEPRHLLDWVGLQRQRSPLMPSLLAFGSGVVVGAAAALALAPRSGAELRAELLARLSEMLQRPDPTTDVAAEPPAAPEGEEPPPVAEEDTGPA